jgi:hypothetical protein
MKKENIYKEEKDVLLLDKEYTMDVWNPKTKKVISTVSKLINTPYFPLSSTDKIRVITVVAAKLNPRTRTRVVKVLNKSAVKKFEIA